MSTNKRCPVTNYEIEPKTNGITLSTDCPDLPCNIIKFDFKKIKSNKVKAKITVTTSGDGTYDSSMLELNIMKVFPYFKMPLNKIELSLGQKTEFIYTSP